MMQKIKRYQALYANRTLSSKYPNLEHLGSSYKKKQQEKRLSRKNSGNYKPDSKKIIIECFFRLADLNNLSKRALDIGCGPTPTFVKELIESGLDAKGIEPVDEMCRSAQDFLSDESRIIKGHAEKIPVPDNSQSFVVLNSVLEHVTSPILTLNEIYRVLEPGGVAYISTTNRYMFHNSEYIKRFFQWYPAILKESYVFMHLHYQPKLANYSSRPAVHWFSYSDLCKLGRYAGFFSFYSPIDLVLDGDIPKGGFQGVLTKHLFQHCKYNPLLRSLVLTFTGVGGTIFMVKER